MILWGFFGDLIVIDLMFNGLQHPLNVVHKQSNRLMMWPTNQVSLYQLKMGECVCGGGGRGGNHCSFIEKTFLNGGLFAEKYSNGIK